MAKCKCCGWTFSGRYCPKCGTEYIDENAFGSSEVTLSSSESREDMEAGARRKLWDAMHRSVADKSECVGFAKELETYAPKDYYANFVETVFSGSQNDVYDFLCKSSGKGMDMYADTVLDYIIFGHMTTGLYTAVRSYKGRSRFKDSAEYESEIERFVPESVRREREKAERIRRRREEIERAEKEIRDKAERLEAEKAEAREAKQRKKEEAKARRKEKWVYPRAAFSIIVTGSVLLAVFITLAAVFSSPVRHWFIAGCVLDAVFCTSLFVRFFKSAVWEKYATVTQCVLLAAGLIAALYGTAAALIYGIMMMVAMFVNGALYLVDGSAGNFHIASYNVPVAVMFMIIAGLYFLDFGLVYADGFMPDIAGHTYDRWSRRSYEDYESHYSGEYHTFFFISWFVILLCTLLQMWCNVWNKGCAGFGMNMIPGMVISFFVILYAFMLSGSTGNAFPNNIYPLGYWINPERNVAAGYGVMIALAGFVDYIKFWFCREVDFFVPYFVPYFVTRIVYSIFECVGVIFMFVLFVEL